MIPVKNEKKPRPINKKLDEVNPIKLNSNPVNRVKTRMGKKTLIGLKKAETERIKPKVRTESLKILTLVFPFRPKYWIGS